MYNTYRMFRFLAIECLFNKVEKSESRSFCSRALHKRDAILTESIPHVKIKGMVTVTVKIKGMVTVTVKIKGMVTVTVKIKGMVKGQLPTADSSRNPPQRNQQAHACYTCLPFPCNRGKHQNQNCGHMQNC
jgi:hypothetical protein